jgi:ABC-type Mn2+/Zn2+ transport system ATPase subunit
VQDSLLQSGELLRLEHAVFGYQGRTILAGVELVVGSGQFLGIVGPNGAGKTTLFRGALGLIAPMRGRVVRARNALGYVPQREGLDPLFPLSVEEVVHMGAYGRLAGLRRLREPERALAHAMLGRVGLEEHARARFASLSGGQRQRVLIARALMARPRLLLLDEPTSGVDRAARRVILELLRELNAKEGLAILLVSHELTLLREAVREVLWVAGGQVERRPADELLRPENLDTLFSALSAGETG